MVAALGVLMFLAGMNNALSPHGTYAPVEMAVGMQGTFGDPMVMWRAIESPAIIWLGAIVIILTELVSGVILLYAAYKLWSARSSASEFNAAKSTAVTGLSIVACFYLIAFGVICQEWFMLWQDREVGTLQEAFRTFATAMLILVWVNTDD